MTALLPLASCISGMTVLYLSWRNRQRHRPLQNLLGWGLLTISPFLWIPVSGPEFGPVYALLVLPLVAWVFALADPERGNGRPIEQRRTAVALPKAATLWRQTAVFFVAVPLCALASTFIALQTTHWLPWSEVDRLVSGTLCMPLLWGALAYWTCADPKLFRPAAAILLGGGLSAFALYFS